MVLGIGIDIIEIDRIKKSVDKFGDLFINKIFTETEKEYCLSKKNKYQHLAARFAAKEAIFKAISSATGFSFGWKDLEIYNEKNGMPHVKLLGKLSDILSDGKDLKITMSHSVNYVTCFAILYSNASS
jgi:holo-[acyl-carrier protein] synthase